MNKLIALLVHSAICLPLYGQGSPDPDVLWRQSIVEPALSYTATVSVSHRKAKKGKSGRLRVWKHADGRFRWEAVSRSGNILRSAARTAAGNWSYDAKRRMAWRWSGPNPIVGVDEELKIFSGFYEPRIRGKSRAAGRATWTLELRSKADGRLLRSVWLDQENGLPLKTRNYNPDGSTTTVRFLSVEFAVEPSVFKVEPPAGSLEAPGPQAGERERLGTGAGFEPRFPAWIPPGYLYEGSRVLGEGGSAVIQTTFSDGRETFSLFQYPASAGFEAKNVEMVRNLKKGPAQLIIQEDARILQWRQKSGGFALAGRLPVSILEATADSIP